MAGTRSGPFASGAALLASASLFLVLLPMDAILPPVRVRFTTLLFSSDHDVIVNPMRHEIGRGDLRRSVSPDAEGSGQEGSLCDNGRVKRCLASGERVGSGPSAPIDPCRPSRSLCGHPWAELPTDYNRHFPEPNRAKEVPATPEGRVVLRPR